ncbi:MAG: NapC/NirT family cytochrome c [Betaproteobacteria bacterium]|nr:NapC/NirT family cytochrome c [Betaproteobacteria bacterium]MCL2162511.1 NapC/NirT family cytochrome c [Betaproteobacteria bacterium]
MDTNPPIRISASDRRAREYRRERKRILSLSVIVVFVLGIASVGVFNMAMDWTSREEFCVGCHEMKYDTTYKSYKESLHYVNRVGVQATCVDCHLPKEFFPKLLHKIKAANDIWHNFKGSINTAEKFEGKHAELAQREWKRLFANDSRECRNCHNAEAFDDDTKKLAKHRDGLFANKQTCIECHFGVVHEKPKGISEEDVQKLLRGNQAISLKTDPPKVDSPAEESAGSSPTGQESNPPGSSGAAPE